MVEIQPAAIALKGIVDHDGLLLIIKPGSVKFCLVCAAADRDIGLLRLCIFVILQVFPIGIYFSAFPILSPQGKILRVEIIRGQEIGKVFHRLRYRSISADAIVKIISGVVQQGLIE